MKFTSIAIALAAAPVVAGRFLGGGVQRPAERRAEYGSLRTVADSERHLEYSDESKEDLKTDYDFKKKICHELNECFKNQIEQVGKLYDLLTDPDENIDSATLNETLCLDDPSTGEGGIFVISEFTRFDQLSFCQRSLSAECEYRKKEAEEEDKALFIELKDVVEDCGDEYGLPCLDDYYFHKKDLPFAKEDFVEINGYDLTCADLPYEYSNGSEYLDTPQPDYDPNDVADFCFPPGTTTTTVVPP